MGFDDSLQLEPYYEQEPAQNYFHTPSATPISLIPEPRSFTISDVVGCMDLGDTPLFYHDTHEDATQLNEPIVTQSDNNIGYDYSGAIV